MSSQGPTGAGTGTNDASIGTVAWANPDRITADDASYASASLGLSAVSNMLMATNFGFTIPASATINGFVTEWQKNCIGGVVDFAARSVKASVFNTALGSDRSSGAAWPHADAYTSYGSSSDLWQDTWTSTEVNAVGFGMAISGQESTGVGVATAMMDYVRVTVTYTAVTDGELACATQPLMEQPPGRLPTKVIQYFRDLGLGDWCGWNKRLRRPMFRQTRPARQMQLAR